MKRAIIDIGSNTINLVIGEVHGDSLTILLEDKIHAKLAKGGINQNQMTPEALERGVNAIASHVAKCANLGITSDQIKAYATATIRSTANGQHFVDLILQKFGVSIEIITGDKEAELIYQGVAHGYPMSYKNVLIQDIGGGSKDLIISKKNGIMWKHSFNLGASRMLDKFQPTEPITNGEIKTIKDFFKAELKLLFEHVKPSEVHGLVGSSGSFDTIRNMILLNRGEINNENQTWMEFNTADLKDLLLKIIPSTRDQRLAMPGMIEMRADYMVIAALFIETVIEELKIKNIYQCNYALTEGALFV